MGVNVDWLAVCGMREIGQSCCEQTSSWPRLVFNSLLDESFGWVDVNVGERTIVVTRCRALLSVVQALDAFGVVLPWFWSVVGLGSRMSVAVAFLISESEVVLSAATWIFIAM